ncbi:triose-phosphate isomerase [Thiomonas delicata]|uniref:Triosephosphate isomerase n=1 Tax=Thiomonas delicata TaxID=364030 RepID=A0A238D9E1_THIDL|nr:triose-phosphate isomerase [Thiomonas delicata]SBP89936.1 triosephosphate isomerase [Thiomonas delicata]
MRRNMVAGNWKMHGSLAANQALLSALIAAPEPACDVVVCVPFPYLAQAGQLLAGHAIGLGAQDCSMHEQGAYTGEVSVGMLREFSCSHVIVGHSERRAYHAEGDALVAAKAQRALSAGITPIVCLGETLEQRERGQTEAVVGMQLDAILHLLGSRMHELVLAYEPVWAIGTGRTATPEQAQDVHAFIRQRALRHHVSAEQTRLLYGGSVKPDNAAELFAQPDIDGGLIGGASLKAVDFLAIVDAAKHRG